MLDLKSPKYDLTDNHQTVWNSNQLIKRYLCEIVAKMIKL